jgi:hypothetical protein
MLYIPRKYAGDYVENTGYKDAINAHQRAQRTLAGTGGYPGGGRGAGFTETQRSDLARIRKEIKAAAYERDANFQGWLNEIRPRLQKHLAGLGQ